MKSTRSLNWSVMVLVTSVAMMTGGAAASAGGHGPERVPVRKVRTVHVGTMSGAVGDSASGPIETEIPAAALPFASPLRRDGAARDVAPLAPSAGMGASSS